MPKKTITVPVGSKDSSCTINLLQNCCQIKILCLLNKTGIEKIKIVKTNTSVKQQNLVLTGCHLSLEFPYIHAIKCIQFNSTLFV